MRKMYIASKADEHTAENDAGARDYWEKYDWGQSLSKTKEEVETYKFVTNNLPDSALILEGGCGSGIWVKLLAEAGYTIIGSDINSLTLKSLKKRNNAWDLCVNDVNRLCFKDNSLDVYLSFGVIEHFVDGPDKILNEAHRVLKAEEGKLIISVPCQNWLRSIHAFFEQLRHPPEAKCFFEYQMTKRELSLLLKRSGFKITTVKFCGLFAGLQDFKVLRGLLRRMYDDKTCNKENKEVSPKSAEVSSKLSLRSKATSLAREIFYKLGWLYPHMIIVVAEPST